MNKKFKIVIILGFFLLIKGNTFAQFFLNGDFENNTAVGDQINLQNSVFNGLMLNTFAFGTWGGGGAVGGDMDIITSATWGGSGAENGLWYVALTGGGSDMFSMDLSAPLIAGNSYSISYWDRGDAGYTAFPTEIGLSTTNNTFGTIIYTCPFVPAPNLWTLRTFTFVAPNNGQYITVEQTGGFSGSTWCHVDNFSFVNNTPSLTTDSISNTILCACDSIYVPFSSSGSFIAGNIYSAELSDATGSFALPLTIGTLASVANSGIIPCVIPCSTITGLQYRIRVVSSSPVLIGNDNGVDISISPAPVLTVNSPTICTGQTANLTASGATSYSWSAGAVATGISTATASPTVTSTYTVTGTNICSSTIISTVTVNPLPVPAFTSDTSSGCVPACISFTETGGANCASLLYYFGDGSTSALSSPTHCYSNSGLYDVIITCTDVNGCVGSDTISNMINIFPTPVADFTFSPTGLIQPGSTVSFVNTSTGNNNQFWNFGDIATGGNNSSMLLSPAHTYDDEGIFCVTLTVSNNYGCVDTTVKCMDVGYKPIVIIPNVFSPNGDNVNDVFTITTVSVKELSCVIYDRWGLKMAEWNTLNGGWDGKNKSGNMSVDGIYFYLLKTTGFDGIETEQTGFLSLVK